MSTLAYVLARHGEPIVIDGTPVQGRVLAAAETAPPSGGGAIPAWTPDIVVTLGTKARPGSRIKARGRPLIVDAVTRNPPTHKVLTTRASA